MEAELNHGQLQLVDEIRNGYFMWEIISDCEFQSCDGYFIIFIDIIHILLIIPSKHGGGCIIECVRKCRCIQLLIYIFQYKLS